MEASKSVEAGGEARKAAGEHNLIHFEVVTDDVEGTKNFYAMNFGWKFRDLGAALDHYLLGTLPNGTTCGIRRPQKSRARLSEEKPGVMPYILVDDLKRAVADAKTTGAKVIADRVEVPGSGVYSVVLIHGVANALWQSTRQS